jgi:hypothetical protein
LIFSSSSISRDFSLISLFSVRISWFFRFSSASAYRFSCSWLRSIASRSRMRSSFDFFSVL